MPRSITAGGPPGEQSDHHCQPGGDASAGKGTDVNPSQKPENNGFTAPRRNVLLGILSGAGIAMVANAGVAAADSPDDDASGQAVDFNFDTGNAIRDVLGGMALAKGFAVVAPMDATVLIRVTHLTHNAWFDAVAPYHPTAVGVYSKLGRRPASERATNRNKNIALLYASHRILETLLPTQTAEWRKIMTSVGLDPDDKTENKTTPIGIGNLAAKAILANRQRDGMNQLGDEGGRKYNPQPYADYLGYRPVNSAFEIRNPSRWQPLLGPHDRRLQQGTGDVGAFIVQNFATPQFRVVKPYSYSDPDEFRSPPPRNSDHNNRQAYKHQADEVLAASAELTDERKMMAEIFDNKFLGIGLSVAAAAEHHDLDLDGWIQLQMVASVATFDSAIAAWNDKHRYDAVRPFSAIRYLYGSKPVTAWGGRGMGTVNDIPANQWRPYLNTADHPEYPSGSASLCAAQAQASRRFLGSDELGFSLPVPQGASQVEPGIAPAKELVLRFDTWTQFTQDCGLSRLWGGVHFMPSITAGWDVGRRVGDRAYEFVRKHIDGKVH
ncbi:vanadium-dependent haloperoxidase [Streptomyces sp. NPDC127197]|uniref:vanadium-dependent haloperoxidase n=1 Tax=Streptomyces sp. NPDC127197 TaxID=3345388 RepID=UPI003624FA0A